MVTEQIQRQSEEQPDPVRGLLFRLSVRIGALIFLAMLGLGLYRGTDPEIALFRALGALVVLTVGGWLAEKIVQSVRPQEAEPEAEPAADAEPEAIEGDIIEREAA